MGKGLLAKLGLSRRARTPDEFRERVLTEVCKLRPAAIVSDVDGLDFNIQWPDRARPVEYTLAEHYASCQAKPGDTAELVRHAASIISISADAPRKEWLAVVMRAAGHNPHDTADHPSLKRTVVCGVNAVVVADTPHGYQLLSAEAFREDLGLSDEDLWRCALDNTRARLDLANVPLPPGKSTQVQRADGLMASLVAFEEFWDVEPRRAAGSDVVALMGPNRLVAAPLSDQAAVHAMRLEIAALPRSREWITSDLIVRRDGRWEVLS
jgi:hypothetical protein